MYSEGGQPGSAYRNPPDASAGTERPATAPVFRSSCPARRVRDCRRNEPERGQHVRSDSLRVHNVTVHRDLFVAGAVPLAEAADRIKYVRPDETRSATFTVELIAEDLPELPDQVLQQLLAVGRDELRREVLRALGKR